MATKVFCDKCGKETTDPVVMTLRNEVTRINYTIDVCASCRAIVTRDFQEAFVMDASA